MMKLQCISNEKQRSTYCSLLLSAQIEKLQHSFIYGVVQRQKTQRLKTHAKVQTVHTYSLYSQRRVSGSFCSVCLWSIVISFLLKNYLSARVREIEKETKTESFIRQTKHNGGREGYTFMLFFRCAVFHLF